MTPADLDAIAARHGEAQGRARRAFTAHGLQGLVAFAHQLGEDVPALVAEVRRLRAALERHGRHGSGEDGERCPRRWVALDCSGDGEVCSCGLDAALALAPPTEAP